MNIDLESCFVGFLIGVAICLLLNNFFGVEGWKGNSGNRIVPARTLTPDQAQDRLQDIIDRYTVEKTETWYDFNPMPRLYQTYTNLDFAQLSASEFTDFTTLLSSSNGRFLSLKSKSPFLRIVDLNLSQAVQLVNCFQDDIQSLNILLNDDEQDLSAITSLNNKDNFKMLNINAKLTRMTGKLTDLNEFTNLVFLNLANTNITDKISNLSLSGLTELQFLGMYGDPNRWMGKFTGDIGHIKNLTKLRYLDFGGNPGITGNINQLSGLTELRGLDLSNTGVSGDINDLQSLINLTGVWLCPSGVSGDVFGSDFAKNLYMNRDKYQTDFNECLNIEHPIRVDCSNDLFDCFNYSSPTPTPTPTQTNPPS